MNLKKVKKAYFIGIKGMGMTALAQVLKERGVVIMGTDESEVFPSDKTLKALHIPIEQDFATNKLDNSFDLVVRSTAYNESHPAVRKAIALGYQVKTYPEILSELIRASYSIGVCGTHGKTTTTALLGLILVEAGLDPTVIVGSEVRQFNSNARVGRSKYLVVESDEYQNKFLDYRVRGAVITNIDYDHPDFFPTPESYYKTFKKFILQIPKEGFLVYCAGEKILTDYAVLAQCELISYGWQKGCDWQAKEWHCGELGMSFSVYHQGKKYSDFSSLLRGRHNVLNALACIAVADRLGCPKEKIIQGVADFRGTSRRFEYVGKYNGAIVIDDFGHHPTEIRATLAAVREIYQDKNIWCVFHPHTFSRTKALLKEFSQSFFNADKIIILDIFGSAREKHGGVHSRDLVDLVKKQGKEVFYIPTWPEVPDFLRDKLGSQDVLITMGAGEAWKINKKLIRELED